MNKKREKNQSVKSQNITEKKRVTVSRLLLFPVFFLDKKHLCYVNSHSFRSFKF